jgi:long-subunit acyl-CoA synthetase (AMP-forming)
MSQTTVAGTLAQMGPFKICDIVHPNIRAFKKWYKQRRAELDEQARQYFEHQHQIEAEAAERRERQRKLDALLKEAAQVAYRREYAAELIAEQVAASVWIEPPTIVAASTNDDFLNDDDLGDLDDCPF